MGSASRRKGKAGELEVARIFRAAGFDVDRVPNSGGLRIKGDLHGELPVHVEVKRRERLNVQQAYQQASDEAPPELEPLAACRMSLSPWLGVVELGYLVGLLAALVELEAALRGTYAHGDGTLERELDELADLAASALRRRGASS